MEIEKEKLTSLEVEKFFDKMPRSDAVRLVFELWEPASFAAVELAVLLFVSRLLSLPLNLFRELALGPWFSEPLPLSRDFALALRPHARRDLLRPTCLELFGVACKKMDTFP